MFSGTAERAPDPPWRLLHVASLNRVKDQGTLLRAFRLMRERKEGVYLDCIGDDTMGGNLQRMAIELGLGGRVSFHGFKTMDAVVPFYRRAHIYVQSSLHENTPAVVLEAAAAGVPTVGTAVGLVAEMAPEAALAVPVRDPEALAEGVLTLLKQPKERARLGRTAQQFARTYDANWTATKCEELYSTLVRRCASEVPPA